MVGCDGDKKLSVTEHVEQQTHFCRRDTGYFDSSFLILKLIYTPSKHLSPTIMLEQTAKHESFCVSICTVTSYKSWMLQKESKSATRDDSMMPGMR